MFIAADNGTSALPISDVNRWFPSSYYRGPNWLVWLGIASSFIAIFIKLWTPISINRIPETLYTLPFFYSLYQNFRWLKKDPVIQLFFAALLWPILAFSIQYLQDPETALKYQKLDNLARLFLFVPIAWWLSGNARTLGWYLVTAFCGLLLACVLDPNLAATLTALVRGNRINFNILNAQHVALYFSIALIGLLSITGRVINTTRFFKDAWKPLLWVACIIISITVILGTQTRAALLGLMVCSGLWVIQLSWQFRNKKPGIMFLASVLLLAALSGYLGYKFSDTIGQRVQSEQVTFNRLVDGDWQNIPYTSLGVRINTWIEAFRWIGEKPLTGWGGGVRQDVIDQTERFPNWVKEQFGHFHNSYIEFTLAYGIVSFVIILGLFLTLFWRSIIRLQLPPEQRWIQIFSGYSLVLFGVMNLFESYMFFWSGVYVITVIMVLPYSLIISPPKFKG